MLKFIWIEMWSSERMFYGVMWQNWNFFLPMDQHYVWCKKRHLHGQKWRRSSLVIWVLCCCRKWKSCLYEGHHEFFEVSSHCKDDVRPSGQRLKLDDQWTSSIIPKCTSKSTWAWFRDQSCSWPVQSSDWTLIESIWWNLKKTVDSMKPKIMSNLQAFLKWGMGQGCSREVTKASKHLNAAFTWCYKENILRIVHLCMLG